MRRFQKLSFLGVLFFLAENSSTYAGAVEVYNCGATNNIRNVPSCSCPDGWIKSDSSFYFKSNGQEQKTIACELGSRVLSLFSSVRTTYPLEETSRVNCAEDSVQGAPGAKVQVDISELPEKFPQGCGYDIDHFNVPGFNETVKSMLYRGEVLCGPGHNTMCTSATFLVFLRALQLSGAVSKPCLLRWSFLGGPAWNALNLQARPDLLMRLKNDRGKPIGSSRVIRLTNSKLPDQGWPAPGDFVQITRNDRSGHSVIFQGYLKNSTGSPAGICYWSANMRTNGYGYKCEEIENLNTLTIGRLNLN